MIANTIEKSSSNNLDNNEKKSAKRVVKRIKKDEENKETGGEKSGKRVVRKVSKNKDENQEINLEATEIKGNNINNEKPKKRVVRKVLKKTKEEESESAVVEESAPAVEESAPAVVEESAPEAVEESAPAVEESAPAVEESAPAVEESASAVEESAPVVVEESAPEVVEESAPEAVEESAPAVEESAPVVEESESSQLEIKVNNIKESKSKKKLSPKENKAVKKSSQAKVVRKPAVRKTKQVKKTTLSEKVEESVAAVEESAAAVEESAAVVKESAAVVEEPVAAVEESAVIEELEPKKAEKNIFFEIKEKKKVIIEENLDDIENKINNNFKDENNYIENLLNESINEKLFDKPKQEGIKEEVKDQKLEKKISKIIDNLKGNIIAEYTLNDIKDTFRNMSHSAILVQILDNKLYYLEKKSNIDESKHVHIINMLHDLTNKFLINDTTFIIDSDNKLKEDKNYVLRFNKVKNNNNSLLINYNLDYELELKNMNWEDKVNKVYVNARYLSKETYGKIKYVFDKDNFEFSDDSSYEKANEYKYVLFESTLETIDYKVDLLRMNSVLINMSFDNSQEIETYYSKFLVENENYLVKKINKYEELEKMNDYVKNLSNENSLMIINNNQNKIKDIFSEQVLDNYMKDILSKLSLKCFTDTKLMNRKIFVTNKENNYLYNRIVYKNNMFDFYFQGKDFEIMMKDNNEKINILVNEFTTNIFYNNENIFNFRVPNLISNLNSSNYTMVIRNNQLFLYKNKTVLVIKCALPVIFNIEVLALRTFNRDNWWIC